MAGVEPRRGDAGRRPGPHRLRRAGPYRLGPRGHPRHPPRRQGRRLAPRGGRRSPRPHAVRRSPGRRAVRRPPRLRAARRSPGPPVVGRTARPAHRPRAARAQIGPRRTGRSSGRRRRHGRAAPRRRAVDAAAPLPRSRGGSHADPRTLAGARPRGRAGGRPHSDVDDVGACRPAPGERAPQPRVGQPHRARGPPPLAQRDPAQVEPPHAGGEPARARLPAVGVELAGEHEPVGHQPGHLRVPLQRREAEHEQVAEHHGLQDGAVDAAFIEDVAVEPGFADPLHLERRHAAAVQLPVAAQQVQRVDLAVGGGLVVGAGVPDVHLGVNHRAGPAPDGEHPISPSTGRAPATAACWSRATAAGCPRRAARTRS